MVKNMRKTAHTATDYFHGPPVRSEATFDACNSKHGGDSSGLGRGNGNTKRTRMARRLHGCVAQVDGEGELTIGPDQDMERDKVNLLTKEISRHQQSSDGGVIVEAGIKFKLASNRRPKRHKARGRSN